MKTEFVLLAGDLDWGGSRMNLERTIRLLSQVAILKELDVLEENEICRQLFDDMPIHFLAGWSGAVWCWGRSEKLKWTLGRLVLPD